MLYIPPQLFSQPHALFAPSSAYRWIECEASIARSIGVTPPETTWQAEEGTVAHWLLEQAFTHDLSPHRYLGYKAPNGYPVTKEMTTHVEWALQWINTHCKALTFVETRVDIYKVLNLSKPYIYGTVDIQCWGDPFILADFKYGRYNVPVENNPQLELYAIGLLPIIEHCQSVQLVILQPRTSSTVKVKTLTVTPVDIRGWIPKYKAAIINALSPSPMLSPSYHNCLFCDAQFACPDQFRNKENLDALDELLTLE